LGLSLFFLSDAAAANLTTTNVQPGGANWTAAIWKTNGAGTAVAPVAGNTYECIPNGILFGNARNNTRIRNPAVAGVQTFPGNSLTLDTNTELRMKQPGAVLNFPGVGTNAGLILNGGVLNVGDDSVFTVTGTIQVVSPSYVSAGDNGGGAPMPQRGVDLAGQLTGSGTLVFMQASNTVAQRVSGNFNTFKGRWVIKAGWLLASGAGSLGTNSITEDPGFVLPLDPSIIDVRGPAVFEPGYDLNSAGVLTLTNGGVMYLHQNCTFSAVNIEGISLSSGAHYYPELAANFPKNFVAGGSGRLTVQPYGPPPPVAPAIVQQPPAFVTLYEGSATQMVATVSGDVPLYYQWEKGTNSVFVNLWDSGDVSGASTPTLSFSALVAADAADYRLVITNSVGAVTSQVAKLNVLVRDTTRPMVAALNPAAGATINALMKIQVTFSEEVIGVMADDLQINGSPATSLSGSGSNYVFAFSQPPPGAVVVNWDENAITDLSGNPLDTTGPWTYTLVDNIPPTIASAAPVPGATVSRLTQAQVIFSEPVTGVDAFALLINAQPATNMTGSGLGPYVFEFPQPAQGPVQFSWQAGHGIRDSGGNLFPASGWTVLLDSATASAALTNLVINEFLAANISATGLTDEDLELSDWLEIYNRGSATVNLTGWSLTDTPRQPAQWVFPGTNITGGQYMVVFASGKDRRNPGAQLHTNFKLGTAGDYLGLFNPDFPAQVAHEYAPQYPEQHSDISYGLDSAGGARYFAIQTPGGPNSISTPTGTVAEVHFSVGRGFFSEPFALVLTVTTPGATIHYTTDGGPPSETSDTYVSPLTISRTTTLRAAAFGVGLLPSMVQTHTYVFPGDVIHEPPDPPGFPITTLWSSYGWPSDYGMDPSFITNPISSATIQNDLLSLPALSIVMRTDDMFGADNGLYTHAGNLINEAPCSVEVINPDGSRGCQCDAGIKMHGGGSRLRTLKHPFRLLFQGKYGSTKLDYPLFPDSPVDKFDQIDLRSDYNNHWTHGFDAAQRARGGLVRDAFFKDLQARMGAFSSHSRYVHLYINGLYWGVYNPCERPNASFAAAYLGGDEADYDAFNGTGAQLVDGTTEARDAMLSLNNTNLASVAQYEQLQQYLDIPQYIDYLIGQLYGANWDWGAQKNWYAVRRRQPGAGFQYLYWDSERTLEGVNDQVNVSPDDLQANLVKNAEYRLAFADRVQKHFFNGGALTPEAVAATWRTRAAQIDRAIVGESARWGDSVPNGKVMLSPLPYPGYTTNTPYTREENWLGEQGRLLTNYFPHRSGVVLTQFIQAGLYPRVTAPAFSQHGGRVPVGFSLTMSPTNATIYYTTNGADPRVYNLGTPSPTACVYSNAVTLVRGLVVKARVLSAGTWSALTEAAFTVSGLGVPIRITEIMYHPIGGDAYEFIELQNIGPLAVDMSGFSFQGITYVVPNGTILAPGAVMVLSSSADPAAFVSRYPGVLVTGTYSGQLSNAGERIALVDQNGNTITSVEYGTGSGWPVAADGGGHSLELIDSRGDANDPANWRASLALNGSPGLVNPPAALPVVRLNELMADNAGAVSNAGAFPDWIEIYNAGTSPVSLANWSLSNSGDPRKFVFRAGTSLGGNSYLVVWCDSQTNAPGLHTGFTLGRKGESVFLYDDFTNRVDAVGFGLQPANFSLGRIGPGGTWQLTLPTLCSNNIAASLASVTNLVINEWLANALPGSSDWLELMNRSVDLPVALSGLFLATSNNLFQVRSLSFLAPCGFAQLFADEKPGPNHLDFKLSAAGDSIALYDASGQLLDSIRFAAQAEGVSQGRLPDGSANIISFPGTASPGASNYVLSYSGPILNEVMARNVSAIYDPHGNISDWLELYNPNSTNYALGGMSLSTDPGEPAGWTFPPSAIIPPLGYLVVWCDSSRPPSTNSDDWLNTGFSLNDQGGGLYLFNAAGQIVDSITFGPQIADLSIGRHDGSWALLSAPTPGSANATAAHLGNANNLRINEWMATSLSDSDWLELYNCDLRPVDLAGLYLTDDPSIAGMTRFAVPPLSFIAGHRWVKYEADASPGRGRSHLSFKLDALGETIRLYDSATNLIDAVDFGLQAAGVSEGRLPDGGTLIISLVPTPGSANGGVDSDGDGLPDWWETAHGLDPYSAEGDNGAWGDPDHDGFNNWQEYLAGTDPLDGASALRIESVTPLADSVVLRFSAIANHSYTIQYREDLVSGLWQKLTDAGPFATNTTAEVPDLSSSEHVTRFYRLVTPALP